MERMPEIPVLKKAHRQITVGGLKLEFQRTCRVPYGDRTFSLPAGLGAFPIYDVADFSEISYPKDKDSIFVAISGGKIVGGAQYDSDPASIVQIYVHPDHRSIGIGRRLLKSIEKVAMNQGKKSISAEATSDSFDFYESCGYEIIEGEDEIMKKRLKSTRKK